MKFYAFFADRIILKTFNSLVKLVYQVVKLFELNIMKWVNKKVPSDIGIGTFLIM
jgi:hypothetical protein